jgi:YbbR domain-containing protein
MEYLRKFFAHNLLIKSISFVLALVLWAYVVGEETQEVQKMVSLEVIVPEDKTVVSQSTDAVRVTVRGTRSGLDLLDSRPLTCRYTVGEGATTGQFVFEITRRSIRKPTGIRVVGISPSVVTVVLDELVTRRLPIKVSLKGTPAEGYQVFDERISLNPNAVLITGPQEALSKLEYVRTRPISLVGQSRPFFRQVGIKPIQGERRTVDTLVDVIIPIEPVLERQTLQKVKVQVLSSGRGLLHARVEPEVVDLSIAGAKKQVEKIEAGSLLAYVDVGEFKRGKYELPVQVILPPLVQLVSKTLTVQVILGEDLTSSILKPAIETDHLSGR